MASNALHSEHSMSIFKMSIVLCITQYCIHIWCPYGEMSTLIGWVKILHPTLHRIGHFGFLRSQSLGLSPKKLNATQQKQATQEHVRQCVCLMSTTFPAFWRATYCSTFRLLRWDRHWKTTSVCSLSMYAYRCCVHTTNRHSAADTVAILRYFKPRPRTFAASTNFCLDRFFWATRFWFYFLLIFRFRAVR